VAAAVPGFARCGHGIDFALRYEPIVDLQVADKAAG
jgi:hypothetical protein